MRDLSKHDLQLPAEQPAIRDKRLHLSATILDFPRKEIAQSIPGRLESIVRRHGERIALMAANQDSLTHASLYEQVTHTVKMLNDLGIGRGDRVALVMSNGLPMAVAFLAITAGVTCAPINPALRQQEFELIFSDLGPKALVVESGTGTAALAAAQRASIPIIELSPAGRSGIGQLSLHGEIFAPAAQFGFARWDDVALMLFTSGTTARPKLVPLTHANLLASAHSIAVTLELSPDDRCLNVMPLFHIHGLIGGLLASLVSGGSVVCPPGFNAPEFFDWLKEFQPTWYSAVPTMHQLILSRAQANFEILRKHPLRFIRSSSAALPSRVMKDLERIFAAPVIESYGMTEAAHQMASNPLPPGLRKPGSVGKAAGPEVAIMDEVGVLQPVGKVGEVVIRGENVMGGYRNSGDANAKAFTLGWFRTGDQGYLDSDGYLFLTGIIKELINRGGEKISPREIDDALMAHPAVEQAVAFAVAHPTLGEEVAAAVVLRRDRHATTRQLMEFVAKKLADFKVPRQIVIVGEIPKSPTGKLQRMGLAERLGVSAIDQLSTGVKIEYEPPQTKLEKKIADIWKQVLRLDRIGRHDNFFHLGGYSLLAVQLTRELEIRLGKSIPVATLLTSPTIAELACAIPEQQKATPSPLIAVQPNGSKPPFFCAHGTDSYLQLARYLGPDQPFYGLAQHLEGRKMRHTRIEDIAEHYLRAIRTVQPEGPYYFGGHSMGGLIAFEMAQQLRRQGQEIALLVLLDTRPAKIHPPDTNGTSDKYGAEQNLDSFSMRSLKRELYFLRQRLKEALGTDTKTVACHVYHHLGVPLPPQLQTHYVDEMVFAKIYPKAQGNYAPQRYTGRVVYFDSEETRERAAGWEKLVTAGLEVHHVVGDHLTMLAEPNVRMLAEKLKACLAEAQESMNPSTRRGKVIGVDR